MFTFLQPEEKSRLAKRLVWSARD